MLGWSLIPPEIDNLALFLTVGSLSAILFSMAKAGFGGSVGLLAVPLMILACAGRTQLALGILLPILIAGDYVAVACWLGKWNWRVVRMLLPGTVVGVGAGWALLNLLNRLDAARGRELSDAWLKIGVGAIALGFVALQAIRALRGRPLVFRATFRHGCIAGGSAGFCSTLAHAAGPVIAMYMLPQQMPKGQFVASTALFFWIGNQLKLVPYFAEGMINTATLGAGLVLLPAIAAGAGLGLLLHNRVNQKQFTAVVYVMLALAGGSLCYKGAAALIR